MFVRLAYKSLLNRKGSVFLTLMAMTVSIFVLLGIEHIRHQAKENFRSSVSGVDLIVGARTSSINLLLYSVFRIGSPTNNIRWDTYQTIANDPNIAWSIPLSLGDSHKGYRVLGTTSDYFKHFSYGTQLSLSFAKGKAFSETFDVVLGSEVAAKLGYTLDDTLILAHGVAATRFSQHDDHPFKVVGILAPTGTPVDQTLHVSLQGIEAIHVNWQQGIKRPNNSEKLSTADLTPKNITAIMLGLTSKMATFRVQRDINQLPAEPLTSILPGVALAEMWHTMAILENTLRLVSMLVLLSALLGLSAMQLASLRERREEVQLLRVIGAPPIFLFMLIQLETLLVSLASILCAVGLLYLSIFVLGDLISEQFGLLISTHILTSGNVAMIWCKRGFYVLILTLSVQAVQVQTRQYVAIVHTVASLATKQQDKLLTALAM